MEYLLGAGAYVLSSPTRWQTRLIIYTRKRSPVNQRYPSGMAEISFIFQGNYSGHSFRIEAAATAASIGIPDHLIKTMGRWLSDAYQLYIQIPAKIVDGVAARLLSTPPS